MQQKNELAQNILIPCTDTGKLLTRSMQCSTQSQMFWELSKILAPSKLRKQCPQGIGLPFWVGFNSNQQSNTQLYGASMDLQVLVDLLSLSVFFKKSSEDSLSAHPQNLKLSQQNMYNNVKLSILYRWAGTIRIFRYPELVRSKNWQMLQVIISSTLCLTNN